MDQYEPVRNLPLIGVLAALGFTEWKPRKADTEWAGKCPVHQPKKNTGSFSFDHAGKFHCFGCGAKGQGAIDLTMRGRGINFREAVEFLKGVTGEETRPSAKPRVCCRN